MEFEKNIEGIEGLTIITPKVFEDTRGFFKETFNEEEFKKHGVNISWVQANLSESAKDVLRGLHWQQEPFAQDKLVRVVLGSAYDVAIDLRRKSPTFMQWTGVLLSASNHKMFLIPKGFAHGFIALEEKTIFEYMVGGNGYNPISEQAIVWNDPDINVVWGVEDPIVSDKDAKAPTLKEILENNPEALF